MRIPLYSVTADVTTGRWTSKPITFGGTVDEAEWACEPNTDLYHCDTYEAVIGETLETRAIRVVWDPDLSCRQCEVVGCQNIATHVTYPLAGYTFMCDEH